ncbi:unnamed protein product, partial [marine sediment metagenome]
MSMFKTAISIATGILAADAVKEHGPAFVKKV